MSKKKIVDIAAIVIIVIFLILIFLLPQISQIFMKELCMLDAIIKTNDCDVGRLLFYVMPTVSAMWIVVRGFGKLVHFL